MHRISNNLKFFLALGKANAILARRLDSSLNGLGFSEFQILYHLSQTEGEKMRRVDLAEKTGLTASGVTRLLLPMEKIGLVKKEADKDDARVSFVSLAPGGKKKLEEALERAELLGEEKMPSGKGRKIEELTEILDELAGRIG